MATDLQLGAGLRSQHSVPVEIQSPWSPPQPQESLSSQRASAETAPQSWRRGQSRWMQSAGAEPDAEYAVPAGKAPAEVDIYSGGRWNYFILDAGLRGVEVSVWREAGQWKRIDWSKARRQTTRSNWCIFMMGIRDGEFMRREK